MDGHRAILLASESSCFVFSGTFKCNSELGTMSRLLRKVSQAVPQESRDDSTPRLNSFRSISGIGRNFTGSSASIGRTFELERDQTLVGTRTSITRGRQGVSRALIELFSVGSASRLMSLLGANILFMTNYKQAEWNALARSSYDCFSSLPLDPLQDLPSLCEWTLVIRDHRTILEAKPKSPLSFFRQPSRPHQRYSNSPSLSQQLPFLSQQWSIMPYLVG